MPVSYGVEGQAILFEAVGEYTPAELRATVNEALATAGDAARPLLLFDLRRSASLADRSGDEVRGMAAF